MEEQPQSVQEKFVVTKIDASMRIESLILQIKPYVWQRWVFFAVLAIGFLARMIYTRHYYYAGYIAGLYILQATILFLSPKHDPDLYGKDVLPTAADGDYKPFVRKLPEFTYWRRVFVAALLAFISCILPFDLPVYGPLLLVYFIIVSVITFRTRIKHMIKYKYVPFDIGKPKYTKPSE